jgi:hypothetical protein
MEELVFPPFDYKIINENGKVAIFDIIRKKHVILTPEEWVRQHLVHYFINELNYPKSLISVEDGLKVNKMQKRSDIIMYNRVGQLFMLVECKSAKIKLNQSSMIQLSNYNQKYHSEYLALTNGLKVYVCKMDYENKKAEYLDQFPSFK